MVQNSNRSDYCIEIMRMSGNGNSAEDSIVKKCVQLLLNNQLTLSTFAVAILRTKCNQENVDFPTAAVNHLCEET